MEGGGIGSATGLAAPNAGQVGSAPTRDIKKKQGDRIEVTKNASWHAGARAGLEKTAMNMAAMRTARKASMYMSNKVMPRIGHMARKAKKMMRPQQS